MPISTQLKQHHSIQFISFVLFLLAFPSFLPLTLFFPWSCYFPPPLSFLLLPPPSLSSLLLLLLSLPLSLLLLLLLSPPLSPLALLFSTPSLLPPLLYLAPSEQQCRHAPSGRPTYDGHAIPGWQRGRQKYAS